MERLTERDLEIVRLLSDGQSMSDIAAALGVTYKTQYMQPVKADLGLARAADLVPLSIDKDLI